MKHEKTITLLSSLIAVLAIIAASAGIFSSGGPGPYDIETVRGETVTVYGKGIYKHMSVDVAPPRYSTRLCYAFCGGTFVIDSPCLGKKRFTKGAVFAGEHIGYFLVTYLFYLVMGMYNILFLGYVMLLGASFFAFSLTLFSFDIHRLPEYFGEAVPIKFTGGFLMFSSIIIGLLWLSLVVPPFFDGTIIPSQVEHYTTLIVQGLDLALLLPLAFVSGVLFIKESPMGLSAGTFVRHFSIYFDVSPYSKSSWNGAVGTEYYACHYHNSFI